MKSKKLLTPYPQVQIERLKARIKKRPKLTKDARKRSIENTSYYISPVKWKVVIFNR